MSRTRRAPTPVSAWLRGACAVAVGAGAVEVDQSQQVVEERQLLGHQRAVDDVLALDLGQHAAQLERFGLGRRMRRAAPSVRSAPRASPHRRRSAVARRRAQGGGRGRTRSGGDAGAPPAGARPGARPRGRRVGADRLALLEDDLQQGLRGRELRVQVGEHVARQERVAGGERRVARDGCLGNAHAPPAALPVVFSAVPSRLGYSSAASPRPPPPMIALPSAPGSREPSAARGRIAARPVAGAAARTRESPLLEASC